MGIILLVLLLALILGGLGFAIHILWWIALIVLVIWLIGFVVRVGEGGSRSRWYRWLPTPAGANRAGSGSPGSLAPGPSRGPGAGSGQGGEGLVDGVVHRQPVGQAGDPQRLGVAVARAGQQEPAALVRLPAASASRSRPGRWCP